MPPLTIYLVLLHRRELVNLPLRRNIARHSRPCSRATPPLRDHQTPEKGSSPGLAQCLSVFGLREGLDRSYVPLGKELPKPLDEPAQNVVRQTTFAERHVPAVAVTREAGKVAHGKECSGDFEGEEVLRRELVEVVAEGGGCHDDEDDEEDTKTIDRLTCAGDDLYVAMSSILSFYTTRASGHSQQDERGPPVDWSKQEIGPIMSTAVMRTAVPVMLPGCGVTDNVSVLMCHGQHRFTLAKKIETRLNCIRKL